MSRTWKDRPTRVLLHENMRKGLIHHDHVEHPPREGFSRWASRELSKTFSKGAVELINEYRAYLDSFGEELSYEVIEHNNALDHNELAQGRVVYSEKTVEFLVAKRYRSVEMSALCTDAEHYDNLTKTDKRDGKRARCTPRWTPDLNRWGGSEKNAPSRSSVRTELQAARALANAGELDEYYSSALVEEPYGAKVWIW